MSNLNKIMYGNEPRMAFTNNLVLPNRFSVFIIDIFTVFATYRGSSLHTVSVHTDSHHTVFSGPPRQGFDGFYGTLDFKDLL